MFKYDQNVERYGIKLVNDRVIRKEAQFSTYKHFEFLSRLARHLIANPDPTVVPVYKFEVLEEAPEGKLWGTFRYAYEMMRLPMLSREEKSAINTFFQHRYNMNRSEDPYLLRDKREFPELAKFMSKVFDDDNYTDLHDGNFLKDEEGNYRIIDLEGFSRYPGVGHLE